jgi:hypothetical protein
MCRFTLIAVVLLVIVELSGCGGANHVIPQPGKITVEEALEQVGRGLNQLYVIGKDQPRSGLIPSEVTIDFNISASTTDTSKLYVEAGATPLESLAVTKAGVDIGTTTTASRGNKITIKLINLFLSDSKDSLIMVKTPEQIATLLKTLKDAGYEPIIKTK